MSSTETKVVTMNALGYSESMGTYVGNGTGDKVKMEKMKKGYMKIEERGGFGWRTVVYVM